MKIKTYYELPQGMRTFIWVMLCLLNILVVFMACLTSARSVQGYTLAVTGFVLLLMTYAHEKERRKYLAWPLIAYAFYSILVCIHSFIMHMGYRDVFQEMVARNGVLPYADSYVPLILGGISIVTTVGLGFLAHYKKTETKRLMQLSFTFNLIIFLILFIV
ncbi:MAG: hypothetical protein K6A77_02955 [Clostridiales bacterium]|nr:hypothetical protein [Clostridiales bacterium]